MKLLDRKIGDNGETLIPDYLYPRLKLLAKDKKYQKDILNEPKHFLYEYHPELTDYLIYHDILDRFSWMLKLRYSPRTVLKNKGYRIDELFQYYIQDMAFSMKKIKTRLIKTNVSKKRFVFHLLQGWYNEIAAAFPFAQGFEIGSSLSYVDNDYESELFPSWKIIKSYYSIYSFFTALVFTENKQLNTIEHRKSSVYFNRHQLAKYSRVILKYPFNIYYKKHLRIKTFLDVNKNEWKYKYSLCPRGDKSIYVLENEYRYDIRKMFSKEANANDVFTILDVLYKFRIWSNYQGINTIKLLKQGGLLLFLERNLYTINFITAGIVELVAISLLGRKKYKKVFEEFYLEYIRDNDSLYGKWYKIPQIIRYRVYNHLKILDDIPEDFLPPSSDEISLI